MARVRPLRRSRSRREFFAGSIGGLVGLSLVFKTREAHAKGEKVVTLRPLGDGQDDWPTLLSMAAQVAYEQPILMLPGKSGEHWLCQSAGALPSGTTILGTSDTIVEMSLSAAGHQQNSAFLAVPVPAGNDGTLAADATLGASELSLALQSAPSAGQAIQITTGTTGAVYDLLQVSGSGPYVVIVDRPVLFPFAEGSAVSVLTSYPCDIRIFGGGMRVTGTGDRCVEFVAACRCRIEDLKYETSGGAISDVAMSFDVAGRENVFARCSVDLSSGPALAHGILLESQERSQIVQCTVSSSPYVGLYMVDSYGSTIADSSAVGCKIGVWIGTDEGFGNIQCAVLGCTADTGETGIGTGLASGTVLSRCVVTNQSDAGISIAQAQGTSVLDCRSTGNSRGLIIWTGATKTFVRNIDVSQSITCGVLATTDVDISGLVARGITSQQSVISLQGPTSALRDFDIEMEAIGHGVDAAGNLARISGGTITMANAGSIGIYAGACGTCYVDGSALSGGACAVYLAHGATLRSGPGVDFSGCKQGVYVGAGCYGSTGSLVANGSNVVNVSWPDLQVGDDVSLERLVDGGTVGGPPRVTKTPGVGFSVTADGGDTSTYRYSVSYGLRGPI